MNKLRLIRIYELRGKVHPIEAFILGILDGMKKVNNTYIDHYHDYVKDDRVYFYHNLNNNVFWVSEQYVMKDFYHKFGYSTKDSTKIIKYLLEKHLKINISIIFK